MNSTTAKKWYLLRCRPKQDDRAVENLQRQGLVCISFKLPVINGDTNGKSRSRMTEPLFPGYIFLQAGNDPEAIPWSSISSTRGVIDFVRFSPYPAVVPSYVIGEIQSRLDSHSELMNAKPEFAPGSKVRVVNGVFEGLEAVYQSRVGLKRSIILLNLIQGHTAVTLQNNSLAVV